jgi:pyruvate dehydrogenase E2 component (dihydrolipoamide acetyltransferase)/2-oxoisovalerate dehydrogenase E2 component (dihydrolipoyl transacylase)
MDFALPQIGEGVYEAELVRWLVQPGDLVKRATPLVEVLTDKATMEVPAPFAGTVETLRAAPGDTIKVGQVILDYRPVEQATPTTPALAAAPVLAMPSPVAPLRPAAPVAPAQPVNGPTRMAVKAAPSVRQLARRLGVDLTTVQGSGPHGRILIDDLTAHLRPGEPGAVSPGSAEPGVLTPERERPRPEYGRPGTRIKLQGLRRRIAEHMVRSKSTIPHYSYVDECDVTDLVKLRASLKDVFSRDGIKLTYLPFFVKAVAAALKEVPIVNSSLEEDDGEIVLHDRYHVGIAVATSAGLIVPVVRDADRKDLPTIAREIERVSEAARAGKAKLEDLRGGTFTITSVGSIGGLISAPIINHPEVGILGIGKVVRRPVFDDGDRIRAAELVYLSFSFDHRIVDGAVGAAFGNAVLRQLQNPAALLLPEKLG